MGQHIREIRVIHYPLSRVGMTCYRAVTGYGPHECCAEALDKWDAIGFLVDLLLKYPGYTLANSVRVVNVASE